MPDRLHELESQFAILNHLVHQLWVREFAKSANPIQDTTDYVKRMNETFADAPPVSGFPEAVATDLQEKMISFFETVLVTLRRELERGQVDA